MEYLAILILFFIWAVYLEYKYKVRLYHSLKERLIISSIFLIVGIIWDHFAVWRQHWTFPGPGLVGIKIGFLPIEEYLFFIVMPFWVITLYKVLEKKFHGKYLHA